MGHYSTRREFLEFMGRTALVSASLPFVSSCSMLAKKQGLKNFTPVHPTLKDDLVLAKEFSYSMVATWGQALNNKGEAFGFNCDYIACLPSPNKNPNEQILWVNHEAVHPMFVSGYKKGGKRTKAQVLKEQAAVGGSFIKIARESKKSPWKLVSNDPLNRRISGQTKIPIVSDRPIAGKKVAVGSLGNCAGGVTPWGTILTCEENYHDFYGEVDWKGHTAKKSKKSSRYQWENFFDFSPLHYGWVVEANPITGAAKKLTSMGRMAHECATVVPSTSGLPVVYLADDKANEHLYKFIPSKKDSLEKGELFVADLKKGEWVTMDINKQEVLKKNFKDQTEVLIRAREAAKLLGATELDRPEDIERDPKTGHIYVALTNNKGKNNYHGSILKIVEQNNDSGSMKFTSDNFLIGGEESGFSCPDNLVFDHHGDLWMTSDISGGSIGKDPYKAFGNNGLFYIPMSGGQAGKVFQVASAPVEAEFTGPCFSVDGKTLFLSVQHPGERSKSMQKLSSHWPDGGISVPRPTVVAISVG